jgi:hypothetical protein
MSDFPDFGPKRLRAALHGYVKPYKRYQNILHATDNGNHPNQSSNEQTVNVGAIANQGGPTEANTLIYVRILRLRVQRFCSFAR